MPPKKQQKPKKPKKSKVAKRKVQHGKGFFDVLGKGLGFLKDTKLLSKGLSMIPHAGAQTAGSIAGQLGLGNQRQSRNVVSTNR